MRLRPTATTAAVLVACALVLAGVAPAGAAPAVGSGHEETRAQSDECTFPVTETDATGAEVTVGEEPERIVVLAPSTAQVMWEIDARERVVGMPVNPYTAYLEGSEERENVVNQDGSVNREQVVALEPDLVLAANITPNETVSQLRDAGLTVYKPGFGDSLESIYAKTELFGRFVGNCEEAATTVEETRSEVDEIRETVEGRERPRVLYYFFNYTAGSGTFISEVVEAAGGENVAASAGVQGYRPVNDEAVADWDPEWIVVPSDAQVPEREPYTSTTAYEQNQTLVVDTNLISQPGPRVVEPMRKMAEAFHPEAFEETPTPTATETDEPTPTAEATDSPTETAGDGVGMGPVSAVVALLAVALAATRRT